MSGQKCSYFLCSKSKNNTPGLRTFSFPVRDPVRCEKWIANSGNSTPIDMPLEKLKTKFLCINHFKEEHILSKKLTLTAVPIPYEFRSEERPKHYGHKDVQDEPQASTSFIGKAGTSTPLVAVDLPSTSSVGLQHPSTSSVDIQQPCTSKTAEIRYLTPLPFTDSPNEKRSGADNLAQVLSNMPSPRKERTDDTPRKRALRQQLFTVHKKLDRVSREFKRKAYLTVPRSSNQLTSFNRSLVNMQLYHKNRTAWTPDEKKTALSLYYKSPATYNFMRSRGCILPSPSTITSWLKSCKQSPGYNKHLFRMLQLKVETMTGKAKECVLLFDEMAIKKCIEFSQNKDVIEGFEDLGEFGRRAVCAKQALVLMVRSLYANWKIPIAFYFTENGVKAEQLLEIIKKNLNELNHIGVNILCILADQSTTNQRLFRLLNITVERPFFLLAEKKYFGMFDPPHILKSLRNNLLNGSFIIDGNVINFGDIQAVYELDKKSSTGKALPKLTDAHLNPSSFQKMNVRLAAQTFSYSVAAALRTAIDSGEIKSETAKNTADFIELIDNTFDALNSRNLYAVKQNNRAMSDKNTAPVRTLLAATDVFEKLQKLDSNGQLKRPPCFDTILITMKAVQLIFETQKSKGYDFLLTSRLNQDVLENQFSIYRQRGGYSRNPTVRTFQAAFKSNLVMNLMRPVKGSNCEADFSVNLLTVPDLESHIIDSEEETEQSDSSNSSQENIGGNSDNFDVSLQECSVVYFAGYLLKKCLEKFNCIACETKLTSTEDLSDKNDIFLFYKNFNINNPCALKKPSHLQHRFAHSAMNTFSDIFVSKWKCKKLSELLSKRIEKKVRKVIPQWFQEDTCATHRKYMLNLLINTLIYKECKIYSASIKSSISSKKSEKLQIVLNQ